MRRKILTQIAKNIETDYAEDSQIGLLAGRFGKIFFLYHYSSIEEKYKKLADLLLEEYLDDLSGYSYLPHTYCTGIAGVGVGMYILAENGYISFEDDFFDDIDIYLTQMLHTEIRKNNADFLHGAIGLGFYFIKRYSRTNSTVAAEALVLLYQYLEDSVMIEEQNQTAKWLIDPSRYEVGGKINISLSHGMSSIVIFLSRLSELSIVERGKVLKLLRYATNYLKEQKQDPGIYGSYFPSLAKEDRGPQRSRLAWCYGDLGIAIALKEIARILEDDSLSNLALEVFLFSASRKDSEKEIVLDAGLCHGSAGLAQIFYSIYKYTDLPELFDAYNYWDNITLEFAFKNGSFAEYKKYIPQEKKWEKENNILEGSAGVAMSLLSPFITNWDEILLLNH